VLLFGVPHQPITAAIALGSNVGDRRAHIEFGFDALARLPDSRLIARSTVIETAAAGPVPQGPYLNAAAVLDTALRPSDLLAHLLAAERERGRDREREQRWGPRTLDLDLLLFGDRIIHEPGLTIPHPRLHERLFVLEPLAEIAAGTNVPGLGQTVGGLLDQLRHATQKASGD
jgi:2-amino-4-hydroxy-6-hydroxymethyldihydropteridine diphosphokinase